MIVFTLSLPQVELLELLAEVDLLPVIRLAGPKIQSNIVEDVVLKLLGDPDHRVRQSASTTLVRCVSVALLCIIFR